ncbi:hypothetical protein GGX14DRAFT_697973 [Mycena pura]|uniref:Uncharacterized protein n=1 Tax=Mycena pura TaxID=153505 RepID=A0AAD6VCX3_9AGAR|nr:hypothetical protein GGX14DRAFT_697973 [Mycena pura]
MFWLALFSPFLLLLNEAGHARKLTTRQGFDSDCDFVCSGLIGEEEVKKIMISIQNSTLCTNANIQAFAKCLDCAFQDDGDDSNEAVIDAQSELDSYVSDCQAAGFSVQSASVTSGAGPTGTGAVTGTQSPAKTTGAKTTSPTDESSTDDSASATDAASCVVASASASDGAQTNGSASASGIPCTAAPSASASGQPGSNGASLTTVRWGTAMALGLFGFAVLA